MNPPHAPTARSLRATLLVLLATLALVACGERAQPDQEPAAASTHSGFPRTLTTPGGDHLLIPHEPVRVIPANANALDFVLALIEPERVAAISIVSLPYSLAGKALVDWPEEKLFGAFTVEEMVSRKPDLIVTHDWQSAQTVAILRESGIPVLVVPSVAKLEDNFTTLTLLGEALGAEAKAAETVRTLKTRIAELGRRGRELGASVLSYTNTGVGGTCAGSNTSFAVMTEIAGVTNLGAEAGLVGYENIDNEWLMAIDPEWIVVGESAEAPGTSASEQYLLETRALSGLRAVRSKRIVRMQSDFFYTSSHHLVDAAERLLDELEALAERE